MNVLTILFKKTNFLSFLDIVTLLKLYQTNKTIRKLLWISGKKIWYSVLSNAFSKNFRYWFKHVFYPQSLTFLAAEHKETIEYQLQFTKNLFRNPSGKKKFEYWKVLKNTGNGWAIETKYPHLIHKPKKLPFSFVGGTMENEMMQVLDISSFLNVLRSFEYKCEFHSGVYIARDKEIPISVRVSFSIIGANNCYIFEEGTEIQEELITEKYKLVCFIVKDTEIIKNAKHVALTIYTKNIGKSEGWRGGRFCDSFFRIVPDNFIFD